MALRIACILVLLLLPSPAGAQTPAASAYLPQGHWAHHVIRQLLVAGAIPQATFAGRRTVTRAEALSSFTIAAGDSAHAVAAVAARRRLLEEFPLLALSSTLGAAAALGGGFESATGRLATGTGYGAYDIPAAPPTPLPDVAGPAFVMELDGRLGSWGALTLEIGNPQGEWSIPRGHAVVRAGPVLFWGGRRAVGYGPGTGDGVVLGNRASATGGGLQLAKPFRLPGFLRLLGPVHFETLLGRGGPSGQVRNPWFWAARGSLTPHPRLTLAINRGALFGGDGNVDATLKDLLFIMIGKHAAGGSAYENQIVAVDALYRPPLPLPVEVYVEWGFEDSAGAYYNVPGVIWGAAITGVPGLESARLGVEHADFARSCCGNPLWYRHMFLQAGWTEDGIPLGHSLGGHGREWLFHGSGSAADGRLQVNAGLALRDRWHENLYAPDRAGAATAGRIGLTYLQGSWKVTLDIALEDGNGWTEAATRAMVRYRVSTR